jgi:hypothetical protein
MPAARLSMKSTIVRTRMALPGAAPDRSPVFETPRKEPIMSIDNSTDVRNTVTAALGLWTAAIAAGTRSDVFSRVPVEVLLALVAFTTAFAIAAVTLDGQLRAWLDGYRAQVTRLAVLGAALLLAAAGVGFAGAPAANLVTMPWAPVLLLGVPLTAALAVAAAGAAVRAAAAPLRRPASTPPARHPAAT